MDFLRPITRMSRWLAALTAATFLLVGLFAIDMGMDHKMETGCSISSSQMAPDSSGCPMSVGEHLTWWSNTFTGIPGDTSALALTAIVATPLVSTLLFDERPRLSGLRIQGTDPPDLNVRDYVHAFLAEGRAQPLLYA